MPMDKRPRIPRRDWIRGAVATTGAFCLPSCPTPEDSEDERIYRIVDAHGLPDHETGEFPNPGCPFPLREQNHRYRVLRQPERAKSSTPIGFVEMGIGLNGVPFDPAGPHFHLDGVKDPSWQFEVTSAVARQYLGLDLQNAHTQPSGAYHYHAFAPALRKSSLAGAERGTMTLLGWGADGFPIYGGFGHLDPMDPRSPLVELSSSYRLREGERDGGPGGRYDGTFVEDYEYVTELGDLDEANGRFGVTPEFPDGTQYYVLTTEFPYIPRYFYGAPDERFAHHAMGPGLDGVPPGLRDYRG